MTGILWALFDRLVDFLANLNPERAAKAQKFRDEAKRLDELTKKAEEDNRKSEAQYAASLLERQQLQAKIAENRRLFAIDETKLEESRERLRLIESELQKANQAVRDRSNSDAFGGGVPRSRL